MNVITKGIIGAAMVAAFGLSHAAGPIYYNVTVDDVTGPDLALHTHPITDTFAGSTHLSSGVLCQATCNLFATGTLSDDLLGDTTLTVTDAYIGSGGSFLCGALSLGGFPWEGSVPHSTVPSPLAPVTFTLDGVAVSASLCGSCSGQIDVTFDPADGGKFIFNGPITPNGNCNVSGTLASSTGKYYDAWH